MTENCTHFFITTKYVGNIKTSNGQNVKNMLGTGFVMLKQNLFFMFCKILAN